jgi:hypothetical protein
MDQDSFMDSCLRRNGKGSENLCELVIAKQSQFVHLRREELNTNPEMLNSVVSTYSVVKQSQSDFVLDFAVINKANLPA